jgi:hypothetical protein
MLREAFDEAIAGFDLLGLFVNRLSNLGICRGEAFI